MSEDKGVYSCGVARGVTPPTVYLAIDPGYNGGYAVDWGPAGGLVEVWKCPDSMLGIAELVAELALEQMTGAPFTLRAVIEGQHAFPARMVPCRKCGALIRQPQGAKSVWTLAENVTAWHIALYCNGISAETVTAAKWMRKYNLPKGRDAAAKRDRKNALKELARQRYPDVKVTLWNADALMMLEWATKHDA